MSEHSLYVFGYPRLEHDDRVVPLDRRKALALVVYLAVTARAHTRGELAALLWPELDVAKARRALRRTLFALREAAGDGLIVEDDFGLAVDVRCDAVELSRASGPDATRQTLERARELYRGDFLRGFSVRDALPFDEWQALEAERFRNHAVGALEKLVELHAADGRDDEALDCARSLLKEDPFHEGAHRRVIELYEKQGRPERAIAQFERYERLFRRELQVEPSPELVRLHAGLRGPRSGLADRESFDVGGRFAEGAALFRDAIATLSSEDPLVTKLMMQLGSLETARGRFAPARDVLARALARAHRRGERREAAYGFNRFGYVSFALGQRNEAFRSLERAISLFREFGDTAGLAWSLNVLGHLNAEAGAVKEARSPLLESLELASELGQRQRLGSTLNSLGKASLRDGKPEAARELFEQSLHLRRTSGHRIGVADTLNNLGDTATATGDVAEASERYRQALEISLEIEALPLVMEIFIGLAEVLRRQGETVTSATLLALAHHHVATWWIAKRRAASELSKLGPLLTRADLTRAVERGSVMPYQRAATFFA